MRITDINKTKRGRFSIFIEDDFYGVLHGDTYLLSHIKIGDEIEIPCLEELVYESQKIIAKERALSLLSARSYTKKKLKEKLLRDVDEPAADEVLLRMEDLGLINDRDYARRYALDCVNLRGFSHSRIRMALAEKGIDRETIAETLMDLGEENPEPLILRQINARYLSKLGNEKGERQTINALQRRGFRYGDIRRVMDHLLEDPNYYDDDDLWDE